jgi:hypothetical protein
VSSVAHALLTLLGAAGERAGMDRILKVNTSKQRQHSLYNQGLFWYEALPNMPDDRLGMLMSAYEATIREQEFFGEIFGLI